MPNKRKHTTLTLKNKMEILKMIDNGEHLNFIAKQFGIGRSTVHDINKRRAKLVHNMKAAENAGRKTLKFGKCPKMEIALYTWYLQEREKRSSITGEVLREKAKIFYEKITGEDNFKGSDGWLDRFKKRYGIRLSNLVNDVYSIESFMKKLNDKIEELDLFPDHLYRADISGLFWKLPPRKSKDSGSCEDRLTFMPCCNATGSHKFKLLVTSTDNDLANDVNLPVTYKRQPIGRISNEILSEWFHDEFVPNVREYMSLNNLPEKALLVLDEVLNVNEGYLKSIDGAIQVMFLPNDCKLEPEYQEIVQIRSNYRKKILIDCEDFNDLDLKKSLQILAEAWNTVSTNTEGSFWKELFPELNVTSEFDQDCFITKKMLDVLRKWDIDEEEFLDWSKGSAEERARFKTDDEICKEVTDVPTPSTIIGEAVGDQNETDNVDANELPKKTISLEVALSCFNTCITWARENYQPDQYIHILKKLRDQVINSSDKPK